MLLATEKCLLLLLDLATKKWQLLLMLLATEKCLLLLLLTTEKWLQLVLPPRGGCCYWF